MYFFNDNDWDVNNLLQKISTLSCKNYHRRTVTEEVGKQEQEQDLSLCLEKDSEEGKIPLSQ